LPFDRPVLSTVHSFDKLRTNGAEGLRAHGDILKSFDFSARAELVEALNAIKVRTRFFFTPKIKKLCILSL
jgi:hypothetical protein